MKGNIAGTLGLALLFFLLLGGVIASDLVPDTQDLMATDAAIIQVNRDQSTQIANLQRLWQETQVIVLPSPSPFTATWTRTSTPSATITPTLTNTPRGALNTPTPDEPTIELPDGLTRTPLTDVPRTFTPTPNASIVATSLPVLDPNFLCTMQTVDNLTIRVDPATNAQSVGLLQTGSSVTIYPYRGVIFTPSVAPGSLPAYSWWYVQTVDLSWIVFARTNPPQQTPAGKTPSIQEQYLTLIDFPCFPQIAR